MAIEEHGETSTSFDGSNDLASNSCDYKEYAASGKDIEYTGIVNSISSTDGWVEIISQNPDYKILISDIILNASDNGEWRIKVDGSVVFQISYDSKTLINKRRNTPLVVPANDRITVEYKTTALLGASASAVIGGIKP